MFLMAKPPSGGDAKKKEFFVSLPFDVFCVRCSFFRLNREVTEAEEDLFFSILGDLASLRSFAELPRGKFPARKLVEILPSTKVMDSRIDENDW